MNKFTSISSLIWITFFGIIFISLFQLSPMIPLFLSLGLIVLRVSLDHPFFSLNMFILLMPYAQTVLFDKSIANIPGAKVIHLLALFTVLSGLYHSRFKIPSFFIVFSIFITSLFAISVFRSIPHLPVFSYHWKEIISKERYLLSYFLKPFFCFVPFVLIGKLVSSKKDIDNVFKIAVYSIFFLSCYLFVMYFFFSPYRTNIPKVREFFSLVLGMHSNDIASFYIILFPALLAHYFLNKNLLNLGIIIISVLCIGLLYSRTAYVLIIFSVFIFLFITKRVKILPVLLLVLPFTVFLLPQSVKERAVYGFHTGSLQEISAGRVEDIWLPLLNEYFNEPKKLVLGNGFFSTLSSHAFSKDTILDVGHSHNMYLEQLFDNGLIGLIIVMFFFGKLFLILFRSFRIEKDPVLKEYQSAIFAGYSNYLIAGFSGRTLYPDVQNFYLWVILGITIGVINVSSKEQGYQL